MRIQKTADPVSYKNRFTGKTNNPSNRMFDNKLNGMLAEPATQTSNDAVPTYRISKEQIDALKKQYNLADISKEDFHKLMYELKEQGVVSEKDSQIFSDTSSGGTEFIRRPIVLGLFKKETTEQYFNFKGFQGGDILDWISQTMEQNESAIDWLSDTEDSLNSKMEDFKNTAELERYNQDIGRLFEVLTTIK